MAVYCFRKVGLAENRNEETTITVYTKETLFYLMVEVRKLIYGCVLPKEPHFS